MVVTKSCRGQPRLYRSEVAAALLPRFGRFCTGNHAIADCTHLVSHDLVAEVPLGLHSHGNIKHNAIGLGQLEKDLHLDSELIPTVRVQESCRLSHGWMRVL